MALFRPLGDRVMMKQVSAEKTLSSGLILSEAHTKPPPHGIVVAVGPGRMLDSGELAPMTVRIGDRCLFSELMARVTTIDGEEFIVIKETDIYAIID